MPAAAADDEDADDDADLRDTGAIMPRASAKLVPIEQSISSTAALLAVVRFFFSCGRSLRDEVFEVDAAVASGRSEWLRLVVLDEPPLLDL